MRNLDDPAHHSIRKFIRDHAIASSYRYTVIFLFVLIGNTPAKAQLSEIGFQAGVFNFTGDLSRNYNLQSQRPAGSVFFKANISQAASLRYGFSGGMLSGNDQYSNDPFNQIRDDSFNVFLLEGYALLEFYFLDYKSKHALIHWTPYLNFGLGLFSFFGEKAEENDFFPIQPAIPLGVGIKYQLSKKFDIGIEVSARATFFDEIDGVSGPDNNRKNYDYGNKYDFDSYYFIGFTLNYTFYFIPCPYGYD